MIRNQKIENIKTQRHLENKRGDITEKNEKKKEDGFFLRKRD